MRIQNAFRFGLLGGLGVLVAIGIGAALGTLTTILTYIGAALFLALGLDPAVSWLERHKFPRWAAILTVIAGVLAVFTGLIFAVVPVIVDQTQKLVGGITPLVESIQGQNWVGEPAEEPAVLHRCAGHHHRRARLRAEQHHEDRWWSSSGRYRHRKLRVRHPDRAHPHALLRGIAQHDEARAVPAGAGLQARRVRGHRRADQHGGRPVRRRPGLDRAVQRGCELHLPDDHRREVRRRCSRSSRSSSRWCRWSARSPAAS